MRTDTRMVNRWDTSRKHIFDTVEVSLKRLNVDYIGLYQVHCLEWEVPLKETMEVLNEFGRSGKVRYIGASLMKAWEFQKMNHIAEKNGWAKFISMQNCCKLIYRGDEREMIPYCLDAGIGGMIYSPLAGSELTGRNRQTVREEMKFTSTGHNPNIKHESNELIFDCVSKLAEKHGVPWAQISLSWVLPKPYTSSVIVGIGSTKHLEDAVASLEVGLTEEEIKYLKEPYSPRSCMITRSC